MGADAVLLVHEHRIVDERRSTPLLLDDDGVVWASKDEDGGVDSVTLQTLVHDLAAAGLPVQRGHLNERRVARATAMVAVRPGIEPTVTPTTTPTAIAIKFSVARNNCSTSVILSISHQILRMAIGSERQHRKRNVHDLGKQQRYAYREGNGQTVDPQGAHRMGDKQDQSGENSANDGAQHLEQANIYH